MVTTANVGRFGWLWVLYAGIWGALRLLYVALSRNYETGVLRGGLCATWWILALLYFAADVLLVLGIKLLLRALSTGDISARRSFWNEAWAIVPIWFLLHFSLLLFEYPVSVRLESVGLGRLQGIGVTAFLVSGVAYVLRPDKTSHPVV